MGDLSTEEKLKFDIEFREEVRELFRGVLSEVADEKLEAIFQKLDIILYKLDLILEKQNPGTSSYLVRKNLPKKIIS